GGAQQLIVAGFAISLAKGNGDISGGEVKIKRQFVALFDFEVAHGIQVGLVQGQVIVVEHKAVGSGAAFEVIDAGIANQYVIAGAAIEAVIAAAAEQYVIAGATFERIVAFAAIEVVVTFVAGDQIIAGTTVEVVLLLAGAGDGVVAGKQVLHKGFNAVLVVHDHRHQHVIVVVRYPG